MLALVSGVIPAGGCREPFTLRPGTGPLIVSMPHSGRRLPEEVEARLRPGARDLPDTDHGIPELYGLEELEGDGPLATATLLRAHCSRYLIDLNRDPSGASLYPGRATTELVPTTTFDGDPIWREGEAPDPSEIRERRSRWFDPYHAALAGAIRETRARHGFAVLWDAHSIRSRVPRLFEGRLPDLNLGTNRGASCHPQVEAAAAASMASQDRFSHVVNGRFTGGWITRHHGRPDIGVHALQMEIALAAYMDEIAPWTPDPERADALRSALHAILHAAVDAAAALPRTSSSHPAGPTP